MSETPTKSIPELRVLVVDDEDSVRKSLKEYLQSFGFVYVEEAKDGYDAYAIIQANGIDIVLSDWEMPTLNGLELLKSIRSNEKYRNIPFIMITSPSSRERNKVEEAMQFHVDAYIVKPFRAETLRQKIDWILADMGPSPVAGVLVVDDEDDVRSMIAEVLLSMGHSPIFQAPNGQKAMKLLQENPAKISLVISDWEMPVMSGIDFLRAVRSHADLSLTPFLMVTSQTSIETMKVNLAIKAEVDHYLLKPFKTDDLKKKVEFVLKRARLAKKVQSQLDHGKLMLEQGDLLNAERLYRQVLALDSKNANAMLGLAAIRTNKPQTATSLEEAVHYIREAIRLHPALDRAYVDLALVYEKAKSIERAVIALREGLKNNPESSRILFQLGRFLLQKGNGDEANTVLMKAVKIEPDLDKDVRKLLLEHGGPKKRAKEE